MVEIVLDGIELEDTFLDDLFVAIRDKIPQNKWIKITKNKNEVVAGIKHMIDMGYYGLNIDVVFNPEYSHFKKCVYDEKKPHPFEGVYVDDTACARYDEIVQGEIDEARRARDRALRKERRAKLREMTPSMKKRK